MTAKIRPLLTCVSHNPMPLPAWAKTVRAACEEAFQDGYRRGWRWGVVCGLLPGALILAAIFKLGQWWGG